MTSADRRFLPDRATLALLPAAAPIEPEALHAALTEGGTDFLEFVVAQDLGPLWHHALQTHAGIPASRGQEALRDARIGAAMGSLTQRAARGGLDLFAFSLLAAIR